MRREVPVVITGIVGALMLLSSFFQNDWLKTVVDGDGGLTNWITIISALMVGIASVNLVRIHGSKIARKRSGWFNSVALLLALFGYAFISIMRYSYPAGDPRLGQWLSLYTRIFERLQTPLQSSMFALVAFYIGSAAYRAFRARSMEASLLMLTAILVMLGNAPIGALIWGRLPGISRWLLDVASLAGQRGILIGASIGGFVTSLRVLVGIERGHLGGLD